MKLKFDILTDASRDSIYARLREVATRAPRVLLLCKTSSRPLQALAAGGYCPNILPAPIEMMRNNTGMEDGARGCAAAWTADVKEAARPE